MSEQTLNQTRCLDPMNGITRNRYDSGWQVSLTIGGKRLWAGTNHKTLESAKAARDNLATAKQTV